MITTDVLEKQSNMCEHNDCGWCYHPDGPENGCPGESHCPVKMSNMFSIEKTPIIATSRKFEFANIRVCYDCGSALWSPDIHCCNGKTETLKEHYERTEGKPFVEDDWSFEHKDMINTTGIDLDTELVDILKEEIKNEAGRTTESNEEHPKADA